MLNTVDATCHSQSLVQIAKVNDQIDLAVIHHHQYKYLKLTTKLIFAYTIRSLL